MISILAAMAMASTTPAQTPQNTLAAVQNMYNQSCQVKAYGAYDDICNGLKKQMREAEKQAKRERAQAKSSPAPAVEATSTAPAAAAAAPPAAVATDAAAAAKN